MPRLSGDRPFPDATGRGSSESIGHKRRAAAIAALLAAQSLCILALIDSAFHALAATFLPLSGALFPPAIAAGGLLLGFVLWRGRTWPASAHLAPILSVIALGGLVFLDHQFAVATGTSRQVPPAIDDTLATLAHCGRTAAASMIVFAVAIGFLYMRARRWHRLGLALIGTVTLFATLLFMQGTLMPSLGLGARSDPIPSFGAAGMLALLGAAPLLLGARSPMTPALPELPLFTGLTRRTILVVVGAVLTGLGVLAVWLLPAPESIPLSLLYFAVISAALGSAFAWHFLLIRPARRIGLTPINTLDTMAIAMTDTGGKILYWSSGCEALYGWSAREAIGRSKRELTGAEDPQDEVLRRICLGEIAETDLTEFHANGHPLRIRENSQLLFRGNSRPPVILLTMTDISEAPATHDENKDPASHPVKASTSLQFGIIEWRACQDELTFHGPVGSIFGFAPPRQPDGLTRWRAELEKRMGFTFPRAEDWREGQHDFALQTRPPFPYRTLAGTALVRGSIAGGDLHATIIVKDTSDHDRQIRKLEAREAELRTIADTVPEAFITMDAQGMVRSFSGTAERLFGYPAAEIVGKDIRLILPDFQLEPANAFDEDDTGPTGTTRALDRSGQDVPVELSIGTAEMGDEHISIVFIRNLREHLAAQARIGQLREQFERVSRASELGELSAILAHELNQPLSAAANFLSAIKLLVERDSLPGSVHELADLTQKEVMRASDIIQGIRQFITGGDFSFEPVVIDELVYRVPRPEFSKLEFHLGAGSQMRVEADPVQIGQVMVNLVTNSVQARHARTGAQHDITITTLPPCNGFVHVRVEDNGPGFPAGYVSAPFEPFRTDKETGMGLGLSYCRRVIAAHGGTMTLSNRPEGGACVEFTLRTCPRSGEDRNEESAS